MSLPVLAYTDADGWHAGIGDPTFMGWVTVVAYFLSAGLCANAALLARRNRSRPQLVFWTVLALALCVLGINKQLDLQTWFTLAGKRLAIEQGWYEKRRIVQAVFILLIGSCGLASCFLLLRLIRGHLRELSLPIAGFCFLVVFVLIRAASFHHIDSFLKSDISGFRMNWALELGGIVMVGLGAVRARRAGLGRRTAPTQLASKPG